ncbi:MAG: enoyl-ACP reductase, partial [Prevotellaceae bacterium]|nr:enoyl-ACP reductase [Prevotellaceae bacterium]
MHSKKLNDKDMYNLLKGKRGLIFGALNEKSIAWKVAERAC